MCVLEYATSLQSEDWGLNMEICDIICETEDGCVSCHFKILVIVFIQMGHSKFTTLYYIFVFAIYYIPVTFLLCFF